VAKAGVVTGVREGIGGYEALKNTRLHGKKSLRKAGKMSNHFYGLRIVAGEFDWRVCRDEIGESRGRGYLGLESEDQKTLP